MIVGISGKIGSGKDTVGRIIQYLTVSDYKNVKDTLKERNGREITVEEHFNSFVERDYKVDWKIKKYGGKLKDIICILLGCTRGDLESHEFKDKELGENWWYYKYFLHRSKRFGRGQDFIRDKKGRPERYPLISEKTYEQEWKFLTKDTVESMSEEEKEYHNVTLGKLTPRKLLQILGTECGRQIIHPNIWVNALFADYKPLSKSIPNFRQPDDIDDMPIEYPNWIITDVRFPNELQAVKDRGGISIRVNRPNINKLIDSGYNSQATNQHPSETALDNHKFDYVIDNNGSISNLIDKVQAILEIEKII